MQFVGAHYAPYGPTIITVYYIIVKGSNINSAR